MPDLWSLYTSSFYKCRQWGYGKLFEYKWLDIDFSSVKIGSITYI